MAPPRGPAGRAFAFGGRSLLHSHNAAPGVTSSPKRETPRNEGKLVFEREAEEQTRMEPDQEG